MSNSKFLYSAVSFQKTFRIDNPEEVQEKLETYFKALFEYKGKRLVNSFSHKCRVKDCQYEANTLRSYFCNLHSSVANLITYRMWGGLCSAENCISKSQFGENKCRFHLKYDKADLPEITKEEIEVLALDIAVEFYLMILEDPTLVFYFGVSIDPDRRRDEHGRFTSYTSGFNYMRILAKMPNTASAGRLEYFVLRFFSEMAGNVHLKNHKAGDDYRPPNDAPSSLYVLVYENARGPNDPDPMPGRDFADNLYFAKKYVRKLPVYPKIGVDIVKEAVKIVDALRYLGYDVKPSKEDLVKTRNQQFKCTDCDSSYDEIYKLKEHIRTVHKIRFVCEYDDCDYASGSASNFRVHMKNVHNVDWHAPKKQKMESYPCGIGDCQEEFETSQKAAIHRKKHRRHMPKQEKETTDYYCGICKRYFKTCSASKDHYKTQMHQANLNKEE